MGIDIVRSCGNGIDTEFTILCVFGQQTNKEHRHASRNLCFFLSESSKTSALMIHMFRNLDTATGNPVLWPQCRGCV